VPEADAPIRWDFAAPIRTQRLVLRRLAEADLDDVHAWMGDPEVARYQLYEPRSREQVAEHIAKAMAAGTLAEKDDWVEFAMQLGERVIGLVYFTIANLDDRTGEIGWAVTRAFQGHGYATEAASAVLDLAFGELGLHRVTAELDPRNDASVALCLRLGMRHEAHFVEHMVFKGAWADTGVYGILEREWSAARAE
jgi:RimJ/RimL family protein N-acetyltransferase